VGKLHHAFKKTNKEKQCQLDFCEVSVVEVEKLLLSINSDKLPGIDNLDGKILRFIADSMATILYVISLV
jgi:hypothetical protein